MTTFPVRTRKHFYLHFENTTIHFPCNRELVCRDGANTIININSSSSDKLTDLPQNTNHPLLFHCHLVKTKIKKRTLKVEVVPNATPTGLFLISLLKTHFIMYNADIEGFRAVVHTVKMKWSNDIHLHILTQVQMTVCTRSTYYNTVVSSTIPTVLGKMTVYIHTQL